MLSNVKITELDLDFVKNYLKVDHDADDALISMMIISAQNYIQTYLNKKFDEFDPLPAEFTIATLSLISQWYEHREIQTASISSKSELSYVFSGLLDVYRNWNDESYEVDA